MLLFAIVSAHADVLIQNRLILPLSNDILDYEITDERLPDGSYATLKGSVTTTGKTASGWYVSWLVKEAGGNVVVRVLPHCFGDTYDCTAMQVPSETVKKRIGAHRTDVNGNFQITRCLNNKCVFHASAEQLAYVPNGTWQAVPIVIGAQNNPVLGTHPYIPIDMTIAVVLRPEVWCHNGYANTVPVPPAADRECQAQINFALKGQDGLSRFVAMCKDQVGISGIVHACDDLIVPHRRWDASLSVQGTASTKANIMVEGFILGPRIEKPLPPPTVTHSGIIGAGLDPQNLVDDEVGDNSTDAVYFLPNGTAVAGHWIRFDFGQPVVVKDAGWNFSLDRTFGNWRWRMSVDCATNWVTDTTFLFGITAGSTTYQQGQYFNAAGNAYRCYELEGVSGNTTGNPWVREVGLYVQ